MVTSVRQAAAILRHLARSDTGEGVSAIARATDISPSSCFNVLKSLTKEGLVAFDPHSRSYRIGLGMIELARSAMGSEPLLRQMRPVMKELAQKYDVAVGLWRQTPDRRMVLSWLEESGSGARIQLTIGQRQPVGSGATGRAILAAEHPDKNAMRRAYDGAQWVETPSFAEYSGQIKLAEEKGWAIDVNQTFRGITTLAAVIRTEPITSSAVLSATTFTGRDSDEVLEELGTELERASQRASAFELHR